MASQRGVMVQKPKTNIYTMLLIIAFIAMCIGCLFLYLEAREYSDFKASHHNPAAPSSSLLVGESALV